MLRRRTATIAGALVVAAAVSSFGFYRSRAAEALRREEESLTHRDLGRFTLELAPFDWDPHQHAAMPVAAGELPDLAWELHAPDPENPDEPGPPFIDDYVVRGAAISGITRVEGVEAHGGPAFLFITGRGRRGETCNASIVPLRQLPGYAQRSREPTVRIHVPTCRATRADMIEIPDGPFIYGGAGEPPSKWAVEDHGPPEQRITLPRFWIDRTEVTNAAFDVFAKMSELTGIPAPHYSTASPKLRNAALPDSPVTGLTWVEAHRFCRFFGKQLATKQQWVKALRGGDVLADGSPNPAPRRNLPWISPETSAPANLNDTPSPGVRPVGSFPRDRSPYGVLDLAGNVMEWTESPTAENTIGFRVLRGGDFEFADSKNLVDYMAIENERPLIIRQFNHGARCAAD